MIQKCQLICPLFIIFAFFVLFQNSDPLFQADILCLVNFIQQDILTVIVWRKLYKLLIIFHSFHNLAGLDRQIAQRIDNPPVLRTFFICQKQDLPGVVKSSVYLINIADNSKCGGITDLFPVDRIRDLCGLLKTALFVQRLDLFKAQLIFVLIQGTHLMILSYRSGIRSCVFGTEFQNIPRTFHFSVLYFFKIGYIAPLFTFLSLT